MDNTKVSCDCSHAGLSACERGDAHDQNERESMLLGTPPQVAGLTPGGSMLLFQLDQTQKKRGSLAEQVFTTQAGDNTLAKLRF